MIISVMFSDDSGFKKRTANVIIAFEKFPLRLGEGETSFS